MLGAERAGDLRLMVNVWSIGAAVPHASASNGSDHSDLRNATRSAFSWALNCMLKRVT
jgi:hypothetical protein